MTNLRVIPGMEKYSLTAKDVVVNTTSLVEIQNKNGKVRLTKDGKRQTFNVSELVELAGPLDMEVLDKAVHDIVEQQMEIEKKEVKKNPGILSAMINILSSGFISEKDLLGQMAVRFPERDASGVKRTIRSQLGGPRSSRPVRLERERNISFDVIFKNETRFYKIDK